MGASSKSGNFVFDQFRVDADKLMLYRDGEEVLIPAKVAKTLAVLVESAGTILSKDELIVRVWEDSIVEESNLTQYLYLLRKILGTMPDGRPYIETLRRRGYRFNGEVQRLAPEPVVAKHPNQIEPVANFGGVEREGNVLRIVDWQHAKADEIPIPDEVTARTEPPPTRSIFLPRLAIAALVVIFVGGGSLIFFWPRLMPAATNAESRKELSIVRLTNGSFPHGATISPDGNYFVYNEADGDTSRMFVQQVGQSSPLEIVTSKDLVIHADTFTPDGRSIYYVASNRANTATSLYRVPTLGGPAIKVLDDIAGPVSFSPDGKEFVFRRIGGKSGEENSLLIADRDGRTQRVIYQRRSPYWITMGAWSPDGQLIAFGEMATPESKAKPYGRLKIHKVSTGEVSTLSSELWDNMFRLAWTPDGKGLVMIATRENDAYSPRRDQVYYVSYPDGVSQRITSDGNRHEPESLGITKDGAILAVPGNRSSQIWALDADGDAKKAVQITKGAADGRAGLAPLSDERVGFIARNAEEFNLMVMKSDGSDAKQLATGFPVVEELRVDPHGRYFVFAAAREQKNHLYRIDSNGVNLKQLTFGDGNEVDSTISPDGEFVVADSYTFQGDVPQLAVIKVPANGGDPVRLPINGCATPTFSPDGSLLSCIRFKQSEIVVVTANDGKELQKYPMPRQAIANFGIGWTPDASGLIYMISDRNSSNLWIQPRDGSKPRQLTNFSGGMIYRYAYSPDGSRLFVARGFPIQDTVLISNYR